MRLEIGSKVPRIEYVVKRCNLYIDLMKKVPPKIPKSPGVYFFLGRRKEVLYIGKATSLQSRVRSYFGKGLSDTRNVGIVKMVEEAKDLEWKETDSVIEALLLEADLIKKFQPKYNVREKDDKSFNCIVITEEDFPRILTVRKKDIYGNSAKILGETIPLRSVYGPFTMGVAVRDVLKIVRRIFPFRDSKCQPFQGKPCFNRQIGLCPGVCTGEVGKGNYKRAIRNIELFFEGKKKELSRKLENQMKKDARNQEFEKAAIAKKELYSLNHIQDVALIKDDGKLKLGEDKEFKIEAYDVAHFSGTGAVGVMVAVEGVFPDKGQYRMFNIKEAKGGDDIGSLAEILRRRLAHDEWKIPDLIVCDGDDRIKKMAEEILKDRGFKVPVVSVVKDVRHKPKDIIGEDKIREKYKKEILLSNAEAHRFALSFQRKKRRINSL
ncbi:MAG: hypothetical protein COV70_03330 [Parcubacteria group bacterium CG11_big_fil_rev_8_21_14_0_20_39_22]|nr:MAG: hypothetical protein COV70_03330 [Parcubacteria group bacterium CG11_big_fil_rev_8_21_14_0_20_39_22]